MAGFTVFMRSYLNSLLVSSVLLGTIAPGVEPGEPVGPREFPKPDLEQVQLRMLVHDLLVRSHDADGDYKLSDEERATLVQDARKLMKDSARELIKSYDWDGDGKLNPKEQKAFQEAVRQRSEKPGVHQIRELAGPPRRHTERGRGRRMGMNRPPMDEDSRAIAFMARELIFDRYDRNKDGELGEADNELLRRDGEALFATRRQAIIQRFDGDGDGKLSEDEIRKGVKELLPRRPGMHGHHSGKGKGKGLQRKDRPAAGKGRGKWSGKSPRHGQQDSGTARKHSHGKHSHGPGAPRHGRAYRLDEVEATLFDLDILLLERESLKKQN